MLKRFLFIVLIVISTMNLNAANFKFSKLYHTVNFRSGIGTNSYFKDDICLVWDISWEGNIYLKKSNYLRIEPSFGFLIGEKKKYKDTEGLIIYKMPFLLNHKLGRQGFLLGLTMGISASDDSEYHNPSFDLALSGGYEFFVSKKLLFDIRLNLGLYSSISEFRTSSILLGIGYKANVLNQ